MFHDLPRDFFRVFDGQPLPFEHEWAESCLLGHYDRAQWVDVTRSGQRRLHLCHTLTPNHYLEDGCKDGPLAPPHAHGTLSYSRYICSHDGPLRHVHALVRYAFTYTPDFRVITRFEVRVGTQTSSIHASCSVNGTSTPTSSSSLAVSRSSLSALVTSGCGTSRRG